MTVRRAQTWRKVYLPEIHDLYPGMTPGADALAALFPEEARDRIVWSVVPNWQGRLPLTAHPDETAALARLAGTRVLHGWTHSLGPDFLNWLFYGHDNRSEFLKLGEAEARDRLTRGMDQWHSAFGQRPDWFCAPRWQLSWAGSRVLRDLGFTGVLARTGIERFDGPRLPMPTLNFDEGEREMRTRLLLKLRARRIRRLLSREEPFRVVIHPHDAVHPGTRAQVGQVMQRLESEGWRSVGLEAALELWQQGGR